MNYEKLIFKRKFLFAGEEYWYWLKSDVFCFPDIIRDWETHQYIIQTYCTNTRVVIQAGGALGMYPKLYSRFFKAVYTFEPDPLNFYCLTLNCQNDNIIKFQLGLSEFSQSNILNRYDPYNVGTNQIVHNEEGLIISTNIDSFKIKNVDLIHLDVEGSELEALKGSINTINEYKPMLLIERSSVGKISEFLKSLNYTNVGTSNLDTAWVHNSKLKTIDQVSEL